MSASDGTAAASRGGAAPSGRLPGFDVTKGLAAIGVVAIHAAPTAPAWYGEHIVSGVTRLAVPLFLATSGVWVGLREAPPSRFSRDLRRFLRLHIVWSLFYWLVHEAVGGPTARTLKTVLLRFGEAAYPGQYYFVILIQIYAALALASACLGIGRGERPTRRFWESGAFVSVCAVSALAGLAVLRWIHVDGASAELPRALWRIAGSQNAGWIWIVYFAFGAWIGRAMRAGWAGPNVSVTWALLAGGIGLATLGLPAWPRTPEVVFPYAALFLYMATPPIVWALARSGAWTGPGWLTAIGRRSFTVFVLNPFCILVMDLAFGRPGGVADSLVRVAVAIAAALAIGRVLERVAPWSLR